MKKLILLSIAIFAVAASSAQNYMVINSEKIFTSIPKYNEALKSVDSISQQYQQKVDNAFLDLEKTYNEYQLSKAQMSDAARKTKEDAIIAREKEIKKYQQDVFGPDGELMAKRVEMIKPVQDKVFATIEKYAKSNGYDLVLDIASNSSIIFSSARVDKTDEIIKLVANIKF